MVILITQRRLQHLLVLVEHAHFGRAAHSLGISQPALTKSLQALETELGVTLLDRQRGALALTAFGELVVQRGKSWLTAEDDLRREIAMLAGSDIGHLRVVLGPYPSVKSGFSAAARLLTQHPVIRIVLRQAGWLDSVNLVTSQTVDLGIVETSRLEKYEQFAVERIGQHTGRFFCRPGHPLLGKAPATLAQLLEFPWVSPRIPQRIASLLPTTPCRAGTIDPLTGDLLPAIEIDAPDQIACFLKDSDTLAPSMFTTMEQWLRSGEIVALPTVSFPLHTNYGFIYLKNRSLPPAAIAYMQAVRAAENEISEHEAALALSWGVTPPPKSDPC